MGNGFLHNNGGNSLVTSPMTAGYCIVGASVSEVYHTGTTPTKVKEIQVNFTGTYRVIFILRAFGFGYSGYAQIYKNGSAFGTARGYDVAYEKIFSEDLSFTAGDLIQIYAWASDPAASAWITYFMVGITPAHSTSYIATVNI